MAIAPSTRYPGQTDTSDPTGYPHGAAKNVSVSGDGTGTPFEKDLVDDIFGFQQALLAAGRLTPSGTPDKVGGSQYLDALLDIASRRARRDLAAQLWFDAAAAVEGGTSSPLYAMVRGAQTGETALVAAGGEGAILSTQDGTWTSRTAAGGFVDTFRVGAASAALVLLAGDGGQIQTSADAITWAQQTAAGAYAGIFRGAAYNGSVWVLVGSANEVQSSADAATWVARTSALPATTTYYAVVWDGSNFVAFGIDSAAPTITKTAVSADGVTWSAGTSITEGIIAAAGAVATDGTRICVAVADGIAYSDDSGTTWTHLEILTSTGNVSTIVYSVGYHDGVWVAGAFDGADSEMMISATGDEWVSTGRVGDGSPAWQPIGAMAYGAGRWALAQLNAITPIIVTSLRGAREHG